MNYIDLLKEKLGMENVFADEPMSKHTSFKVGGNADFFVKVDNVEKIKNVLEISKKCNIPFFILGNGSNILVRDKGIRGIVCKIDIDKFEVEEKEEEVFVTVGSGSKNGVISQKLLNLEIEGFEFASRNTRNNWWSYKNECRSIWKRNERHCTFHTFYR